MNLLVFIGMSHWSASRLLATRNIFSTKPYKIVKLIYIQRTPKGWTSCHESYCSVIAEQATINPFMSKEHALRVLDVGRESPDTCEVCGVLWDLWVPWDLWVSWGLWVLWELRIPWDWWVLWNLWVPWDLWGSMGFVGSMRFKDAAD